MIYIKIYITCTLRPRYMCVENVPFCVPFFSCLTISSTTLESTCFFCVAVLTTASAISAAGSWLVHGESCTTQNNSHEQ